MKHDDDCFYWDDSLNTVVFVYLHVVLQQSRQSGLAVLLNLAQRDRLRLRGTQLQLYVATELPVILNTVRFRMQVIKVQTKTLAFLFFISTWTLESSQFEKRLCHQSQNRVPKMVVGKVQIHKDNGIGYSHLWFAVWTPKSSIALLVWGLFAYIQLDSRFRQDKFRNKETFHTQNCVVYARLYYCYRIHDVFWMKVNRVLTISILRWRFA